jgi:hypothetical protein
MSTTETSHKYPRTHHLPWTDTIGPDGDHVLSDVSVFAGHDVVVTEKLDGENTTLDASHLHARSLDSRHFIATPAILLCKGGKPFCG